MTRKKMIQILEARLMCAERDDGTNQDCNADRCVYCELAYWSGTHGEYIGALHMALEILKEGE